jgi:PAS domain S-box-containing protein
MPEPYTITSTLYKDTSVELYRGLRQRDGTPVIIKIFRQDESGPLDRKRLHNEYEILQRLDSPYVLKPYELDRQKTQIRLILEDFDGEPLACQLGQPLETGWFLDIALPLAAALADIHRQDIVHKDLKPVNVLVNPQNGAVKLTGFGIAARLVHALTAPTSATLIEGSLAYMSPEQTGRMNRGIDHRSDLYSLGVIFYEMLTGELPFQAADPLEWVHCHIARPPTLPTEIVPTIPEPLTALVMRLMAKQAEDRYQTAGGLKADLKRCAAEWRAKKSIAPFPLGTQDVPGHLLIPKKLYGRQREVGTLLAAFDRVIADGKPELVLLSGYSGIGKSELVNELQRALVLRRTLFAGGKYDLYKRDIPYATLSQALQTLVRQVLSKCEAEIAVWREAIKEAVGPNGRLMTDLVPDLMTLIGEQPPVQDVPPQDAQIRFNTVFQRFLGVFALPEHPLVLFLDDLQWIDTATLQPLEHLLVHPAVKHILLIGAYRDNEVGPSHPLMLALDSMRNDGATVQSIELGPLMKKDVLRFTADTFHCDDERAEPLVRLVYAKTGGNPFFMIQFLTALAEEGLVAFGGREERWKWDLDRIQSKGFTDNLADLMVGKLNRLPAQTQEGLQQLACLGSEARLATLAIVQGISKEEAEKNLREAIQAGFLLRHDESVSFLHDRIQEAAYALIHEQQRPEVHLNIGRRLLLKLGSEELNDILFDVVNHLNQGAGLMTDPAEKARLVELNVTAGRRARASIAYEMARDFFAAAANLQPEDAWDTRYDFQFGLFLDWAQTVYLSGAFEEADGLFDSLLARAKTDLDKAAVYDLRLKAYQIAGRYDDAVAMGITALRIFGVEIPEEDEELNRAIEAKAAEVRMKLQGQKIENLPFADEATDPRVRAVIGLLSNTAPAAYIGNRPQLYPLVSLLLVNYSLDFGPTRESSHGYSNYGIMLTSLFNDPHSGYAFSEAAIKLSERFNDPSQTGVCLFLHGNMINFWLNPIATDFPVLEKGFLACLESGNVAYANYIAITFVFQFIERGDPIGDILEASDKYAGYARDSRNNAVFHGIRLLQQFLKCLMGLTRGGASLSDDAVDEASCVKKMEEAAYTTGVVIYHMMKMFAAFLMEEDAALRRHRGEAEKMLAAMISMPMETTFCFLHACALARDCRRAAEADRVEMLAALTACEQKLARWAKNCPANFAAKHWLVSAQIEALKGRELSAERLFEQSIEAAAANGFIHWQAMANEAAARFNKGRGLTTMFRAYLREAHDCYRQWGAVAKVRQLEASDPWLASEASGKRGRDLAEQLDVMTIIKAQHAISGEIRMNRLARTLLTIVMENAGASIGYLHVVEGNHHLRGEMVTGESGQRLDFSSVSGEVHVAGAIVNYVRRCRKTVILSDAGKEAGEFSADPYLRRVKPKSVLCMAIQRKERLFAVLYLENNLVAGVFTDERSQVIEMLAAQAAISLEISGLYETVRANEARFRLGQSAAHIGTWEYDVDLERFWGSDETRRICGFDPAADDFSVETVESCIPERERVHQALVDLLEKNRPYDLEFEIRSADGSAPKIISSVAELYRDEQGRPVKVFGIIQDITARKQAEEELARHRDHLEELVQARTVQLEATNKELEAFAYSVSHDLRAPLRHIDGFLELLQKKAETMLDDQSRHYMDIISNSAQKMGLLIDDLLSFSRMGRHAMSVQLVELGPLVRDVIGELAPDATGRIIDWRIHDLPVVEGDAAMLRIVLGNLIANAIKFTRPRRQAWIEIGSPAGQDAEAVIFVRDNGVGFDMTYEDKLFGVFQRLHRVDEFEGTGIGLASVRRIIARHGGRTWAEGKVDQGATFYFSLPRKLQGGGD